MLFENWDSMWLQIQEMLRIEKGGAEQLADELAAYDPMVPKGAELTCTLLFEIDDAVRRDAFLRTIGGVEDHIAIQARRVRLSAPAPKAISCGPAKATTRPAPSISCISTSPPQAIADWQCWRRCSAMLVIDHPNYGHAAVIGPETRAFLARECF